MRLSISKKLGLTIGCLLSMFVLISVVSYMKARIVRDTLQVYAHEKDTLLKVSYLMDIDLLGAGYWLTAYLYDQDSEYLEKMRRFDKQLAEHIGIYLDYEKNPEGVRLARKIARARIELSEIQEKLVHADDHQHQLMAKITQGLKTFETEVEVKLHAAVTDEMPHASHWMHRTMSAISLATNIAGHAGMYLVTHEPDHARNARVSAASLITTVDQLAAFDNRAGRHGKADEATFVRLKVLAARMQADLFDIIVTESVKHDLILAYQNLVRSTDDIMDNALQVMAKQGVDAALNRVKDASDSASATVIYTAAIALVFGTAIGTMVSLNLSRPINQLVRATQNVAGGDFSHPVQIRSGDEIGELGQAFTIMADSLGAYITERNRSEARFRTMLELAFSGIMMIDTRGTIQMANPAAERIFGFNRDELIGSNITMLMPEHHAAHHHRFIHNYLATGDPKIIGTFRELQGKHRNGALIPLELAVSEIKLEGEHHFLGILSDITVRKQDEQQLKLLASVFDNTIEGIFITDRKGKIERVNPGFTRITGYTEDDAVGRTPRLLKSDRHDTVFYQQMWQSLLETGTWQGEIWNRKKNGEVFPQWQSITSILDDNREVIHYVAVFHDISNIKASQEQLHYQANHDVLTNLPNRTLFIDRLNQLIASARRSGDHLAVLFLDLDKFKDINDTLGHQMGDQVLRTVARRLTACCRDEDTVARLGGDEFMILLPRQSDVRNVAAVAQRINDAMAAPMDLNGQMIYPGASVGISLYPEDGADAETLMKNSDMAMYRSKAAGRNSYSLFTQTMNEELSRRTSMEADLRMALEREEFEAYFQPIIDTQSLQILGVEALMRWHRRHEEFVPPDEFIPLAEDFGLIHEMGLWMLENACTTAQSWHEAGFDQLSLSVNLSRIQFQNKELLRNVEQILERSGFCSKHLRLEITESIVMEEMGKVLDVMDRFRAMGIYMVMDDFGTGYSSLGQLKELPLGAIKIDKSFVKDFPEDERSTALVEAVVSMGKSLGLAVVAEGVETEAQLNMLRQFGCDALQGYLFSKPEPARRLIDMLKVNHGCFDMNGICPPGGSSS
jgi:diguanylate cyclase (GGDEF)-like protein/PAS domain S-box-containing protein